jgi:surfactin synthase thioesterase subunit
MEKSSEWFLVWRKRSNPTLRLFCFPYAGGGSSAFREWADLLPETIELVAVHPPSRMHRLKTAARAVDLGRFAERLADYIGPYLDLPYAFFGHSLGSLVCSQVAQEIARRRLLAPVHLIMSGRSAPHVSLPRLDWHLLDDRLLIESLRAMGGTAEDVLSNTELMAVFLPSLRQDVALADGFLRPFSAEQVFSGTLAVYNGRSDHLVHDSQVNEWQRYSASPIRLRLFPGGHFYFQTARAAVLDALMEDLRPFLR